MFNNRSGSEWNIWDLHVHTPASYGGDDYATLINNLSSSEAAVIGINDYFTLDGYKEITARKGVPGKVIFPVVEFRLHNVLANRKSQTVKDGGPKINCHLIFTNDPKWFPTIETWLNSLTCYNDSGRETKLGSIPLRDRPKLDVDYTLLLRSLGECHFGPECLRNHCLFWLPYDEYGGIDDIDPIGTFFKLHLVREADIMGSSTEKQIRFFKWKDTKFKRKQYQQWMDAPKPCIKGSDSHEPNYPFGRLKNEKSEPIEKYCWIKADKTFQGLKQIIWEPDRVYIGRQPDLLTRRKQQPYKFLAKINVDKEQHGKTNELWFNGFELELNPGLIAIIGKKGNGKSALADIIGLCANSQIHSSDLSFLHRNKFKNPKNNKSRDFYAELTWADGSTSGKINLSAEPSNLSEERAKYIPQNYLEKLCVNEEQTEFEQELKKIIFAHTPEAERLEQRSLDDLIAEKEKSITSAVAQAQAALSQTNKLISRLEAKHKPAYKKQLEQEIENKQKEIEHHDKNKPAEQAKPDEDPAKAEANRLILAKLEESRQKLKRLNEERTTLAGETSSNNLSINELNTVRQEFEQLEKSIKRIVDGNRSLLDKYGIGIDSVITYTVSLEEIDKKVKSLKDRNESIHLAIHGNAEIPGIAGEIQAEEASIQSGKELLDQSEKNYQDYLQRVQEWTEHRSMLTGSAEAVGSLAYFEKELHFVNDELKHELDKHYKQRLALSREIFELKERQLQIYAELYEPVTKFLQQESSFVEEYNIKVSASLIIKGFAERFLSHINQKSRGTYSGAMEGNEMLAQLTDVHSFSEWEETEKFLSDIMESLSSDKRQGFENQVRYADEQLKKDIKPEDLYDFIFSLQYIDPQFKLQLGSKDLKELSPGERGAILLIFYLFLDVDNKPLIIDQPEENLDNESIYHYLVHFIKKAKDKRQIILITHNPNLAVVCDAEQVIQMNIDKQKRYAVSCLSGALENPAVARKVIDILEGTKPAFDNRRLKYTGIAGN